LSQTEEAAPLKPLRILPLRFKLRSAGMAFPEFSGTSWHSGLGMVLAQHSPEAFRRLYQTNPESRLYALLPPMNSDIAAGEQFELGITLFGYGVDNALAVTQAIVELGRIGLRPGGHYEMIEARVIGPECEDVFLSEQDGFIAVPHTFTANDYLASTPELVEHCRVHFVTPLRIKDGGDHLRCAPNYPQLLRRIFGRIDQLAHVAEELTPLAKNLRDSLYEEAERIEIKKSAIISHGVERRSARSGQQMQFSGIVGTIDYGGALQASIPWLHLARLAQLGGKTAFGFGGLEIERGFKYEAQRLT